MKAYETSAKIDSPEERLRQRDGTVILPSNITRDLQGKNLIKVILFFEDEVDEAIFDPKLDDPRECLAQGWRDILDGNVHPISELWVGIDE
jgi:hypothetical protein